MNRLHLGLLSFAGLVWLGCSSAGSMNGTGGAPGVGGSVGTGGGVGSGGVATGTGGVATGTGGVATGTGGVATGTGGVATGTGGSTAAACTGEPSTTSYMDNGTLCGFAWTAMNKAGTAEIPGQSIDPACTMSDGSDCFTGGVICATAEIPANDAATEAYSGVMIGWNVAQARSGGAEGNWTSSGTGVTVTYTATGGTGEVRVILQSAGTDYCAIATSGTPIPFSSFVKECWDGGAGTPTFTVGSPVKALLLQLNGTDAAAQSVTSFCLDSVTMQ